ncbi:MAG TPA: efflux RND transporter periplasmic adaptor subunit [Candidatus Hydrogenedentes bacterium]|nr:efflux RND transporter periplasmic adaptor subunit [Candidatus Hydrogenedentota bacterium]
MRSGWVISTVILMAVISMGCNSEVQGKTSEKAALESKAAESEPILIPVQVELPKRENISSYFETTTRIMAERRVDVLSKGIGQCLKVMVEEGDEVKEGQILAELDKQELEARLRQSRVSVEQQKTAYEIAEQSLAEGIGAKAERDNTRFAYEQAKAALELLEVQIRNQTIDAPISGVITKRTVQQGMMVASGAPVFSIVDPNSYILPINAPEKELQRLQIGQTAKVSIDSAEDKEFTAHVRRINPNVDFTSGTVKVILDFDEESRQYLREAAFARVKLVMETHENAILIPKDALIEENARSYLMVIREETPAPSQPAPEKPAEKPAEPKQFAERIEVQTGLEDSNSIEILSGIDDKTRIVTLGQHTLKAGSQVVVTNAQEQIVSKANQLSQDDINEALKEMQKEN